MFQPHRYLKSVEKPPVTREGGSISRFVRYLLVSTSFAVGGYILVSQLLVPWLIYQPDRPLIDPVAGTFASYGDEYSLEDSVPPPDFFYLSVPKLELEEVPVAVMGNVTPDEYLVHIRGTRLPGTEGVLRSTKLFPPVISGHSVTSWFFNPEDPRTYFARLPDLEEGDEIYVQYLDERYVYEVHQTMVVSPDELWATLAREDVRMTTDLVLFTCVPPGLRLNRLLVFARLK